MPRRKSQHGEVTEIWRRRRTSETGRRVELYSSAYKLAWKQIPPAEKRAQPDLSLRIHASIRRQLKEGAMDPSGIASAALKDVFLLLETH
jgi:hypothetical protein